MMNVTVGQEVAILSPFGDRDYSFGWKVIRITPKSKEVIIEGKNFKDERIERRFSSSGYEMEKMSSRYVAQLEPDVQKAKDRMEQKGREVLAVKAINEVVVHPRIRATWGKESILEEIVRLEGLLKEAREKAEAI